MPKILSFLLNAGFICIVTLFAVSADEARAGSGHPGEHPPHQAAGAGGDLALIYVSGSSEELPPLHEAVRLGHVSVVSELLAAGADANEKSGRGSTPLHWAVDAPVVSLLLAAGAGVNATTAAGRTPLHRVANASVVSLLLAAGAEVNVKDNGGWTPLHRAVDAPVVSVLLAAGADVNAKADGGETPLHRAAFWGHAAVVSALAAAGAEVNAKDRDGETPLHEALSRRHYRHNAPVVSLLLAAGAEVNAKNNDGNTPLHQAVFRHNAAVVSLLLAAGADVNAKDNDGDTPLYLATREGWVNTAPSSFLATREEGWVSTDASTDVSIISMLLAAGAEMKVNAERQRYAAPSLASGTLFEATWDGHASVVSVLIAAGAADVDEKGPFTGGHTPLIQAAFYGHASVVSVLLAAGADVNAIGDFPYASPYVSGSTPLHCAAYNGHASVASLLLAAGADVNATDSDGYTPLDIAKRRKNWDVVALLESHVRVIPQKHGAGIGGAESVFENTWRSVVVVFAGDAQGGGVIVGGPNQVATNCHVVDESPNDIRVYKGAERRAVRDAPYSAEIVAGDRERDVCLLSVAGLWGIAAGVRRVGDLAVGEAVYAVGAPQGFDFSISNGIVSQLRILAGESAPLIQTNAAISPGSSGGGLFDSQGRLVGLTTWKIREGENLNFAVPVDWALELNQ